MGLHSIDGATADRLTAVEPARLSRTATEALSVLAHQLDATVAERGRDISVRSWAVYHLGVPASRLEVTSVVLRGLEFQLAALALAEQLDDADPAGVIGYDQEEPPVWERLDLGATQARIPVSMAVALDERSPVGVPAVLSVVRDWQRGGFAVAMYVVAGDLARAEAYLDDLRASARSRTNPFRHQRLETELVGDLGLAFRVRRPSPAARDEIVHPDELWAEVDENVHGFLAAHTELATAGLARNRGVLLAGPPGTGKTAIAKVLAHELHDQVTVVFCTAEVLQRAVGDLYAELEHLAPVLVVMEDIDLVVGHRQGGGGEALVEFLVALDGAMSGHAGVVTLATTNAPEAIDPAAVRSARIDRVIEVPRPDARGRARILARYLAALDHDVDIDLVAGRARDHTGADLQELVSRAVIRVAHQRRQGVDARVGTELLLDLIHRDEGGFGLYL